MQNILKTITMVILLMGAKSMGAAEPLGFGPGLDDRVLMRNVCPNVPDDQLNSFIEGTLQMHPVAQRLHICNYAVQFRQKASDNMGDIPTVHLISSIGHILKNQSKIEEMEAFLAKAEPVTASDIKARLEEISVGNVVDLQALKGLARQMGNALKAERRNN